VTAQADAWVGGVHRWDGYFAVVLAGALVLLQVVGPPERSARLIASVALLAMVPWYLLVGRRVMYGAGQLGGHGTGSVPAPRPAWAGTGYLAGLIVLLAIAEIQAGTNMFILLALCPQCFMAAPGRRAIAAVVVMNLTAVLIAVAHGGRGASLEPVIGVAVLGAAFSVAFGTWVIRIIEQSAERAALIAELEATRAELAEVSMHAGILAERNRLASEIHDTIAQGFTSILMLAQAAEATIGADPAAARGQLALIARSAGENLAEARALVAGLGPAPLDSVTLPDALARLTERTGQELGVRASFTVQGEPRSAGTGAEVVLLRVCQEALSNARKHARAGSVAVRLAYGHDSVRLEVTDDGIGFDPARVGGGYGLRGMRARVSEIGGEFVVTSAAGAGTTVSAEVA
jgi:signal transduction histidine kinase